MISHTAAMPPSTIHVPMLSALAAIAISNAAGSMATTPYPNGKYLFPKTFSLKPKTP